jgi:outer membrane protein assembly factor BamA
MRSDKRVKIRNGGNARSLAIGRRIAFVAALALAISVHALGQQAGYENRRISDVSVTFEGTDRDVTASDEFRRLAVEELGDAYSAVKVRNAIDRLYRTREISTVAVEAESGAADSVRLRFVIKRKTQAKRVTIKIVPEDAKGVTEQELLLRLNLLDAGSAVTDQSLKNNADLIL